jgi:tetratricopeptide (TPR) repeat protein
MGSRKRQMTFLPCQAFWSLLVFMISLGCSAPLKGTTELRDGDFLKLNSKSYVTRALKDLEANQRNLRQNKGERTNTLILLAQVCCTLGELVKDEQRLDYYEKGQYYAELLIRENPAWADGYYWQAINLCGVAEVGGAGRALRLLPAIVETMEKASTIDPTIDQAGPHRVLGRIFCEAPAWPISVGDINKSLHHLTLAVQIAPNNSTNHLYLAETLLRLGKEKQAQAQLHQVFSSTQHALWPLGVEQDRKEARRILGKMQAPQ